MEHGTTSPDIVRTTFNPCSPSEIICLNLDTRVQSGYNIGYAGSSAKKRATARSPDSVRTTSNDAAPCAGADEGAVGEP